MKDDKRELNIIGYSTAFFRFISLIIAVLLLFNGCKRNRNIKVLTKNTDLSYAKEDVFLVVVNIYRELTDAEHDKQRLKNMGFVPYIIKTYNDRDYFSFYLCVSSKDKRNETSNKRIEWDDDDWSPDDGWKTPDDDEIDSWQGPQDDERYPRKKKGEDRDESTDRDRKKAAEEQARELNGMGINITITCFPEIEDEAKEYDKVVKKKTIGTKIPKTDIPNFSEHVTKCIKQFPINRDFKIKELYVFDAENIRTFGSGLEELSGGGGGEIDTSGLVNTFYHDNDTLAASICLYEDTLFDKTVCVTILTGMKHAFSLDENTYARTMTFRAAGEEIDCNLIDEGGTYMLHGVNRDGSTYIKMEIPDFTKDELDNFLNNIENDGNLLVYPEVRRNLWILPKKNKKIKRDFLSFSLTKIPPSYAVSKGNAEWALPIVGHWDSSAHFNINDEEFSILFFDMEYNYNAEKIHKMFIKDRGSGLLSLITNSDEYVKLKKTKGYMASTNLYLVKFLELSFPFSSYIVAIDYPHDNDNSQHDKKQLLIDFANDLQIWN